jgi:hypothetical protein
MAGSRDRVPFLLQQLAGRCPAKCRNEMFSGLKLKLGKLTPYTCQPINGVFLRPLGTSSTLDVVTLFEQ